MHRKSCASEGFSRHERSALTGTSLGVESNVCLRSGIAGIGESTMEWTLSSQHIAAIDESEEVSQFASNVVTCRRESGPVIHFLLF